MVYGLIPEVLEALRVAGLDDTDRERRVPGRRIGVAAEDGVVILTGHVDSPAVRATAERAVKGVPGVRSVANDLDVDVAPSTTRPDSDIAREALHRLRNNVAVPEAVQVVVTNGFLTLDGTAHWLHQRLAAETSVKYIAGVKCVSNEITLIGYGV
jgi:osmotically-inducible protein OsmY